MELSIIAVERGTLTESDDAYYNCRHTYNIDIAQIPKLGSQHGDPQM